MRKLLLALTWMAAVSSATPQRLASESDMSKLQADLTNLETDLSVVQPDALPASQRERVERIREEVVFLKVKMRKHQESGGEGTGIALEELQALRLEIADLRNDLRPYLTVRADAPRSVTLPSGTELAVRLENGVSSETAVPGDALEASAAQPVVQGSVVAIEAGNLFRGHVELVDRAEGRTDRKARLVLAFDQLQAAGKTYELTATVVRASEKLETGIGSEKTKMGVGAGLGTVLGAVLGGKKGAIVGAVLGGTGAILATEGKEVELPPGTILYLRLDRDLRLSVR